MILDGSSLLPGLRDRGRIQMRNQPKLPFNYGMRPISGTMETGYGHTMAEHKATKEVTIHGREKPGY